jgi:hypothetical protein
LCTRLGVQEGERGYDAGQDGRSRKPPAEQTPH